MYERFFKRLLDITISLIGLPFFGLVFLIIAPLIYFEDKGSIFYNAPRLGRDAEEFKMYKFRSMKMDAPDIRNEDGSTYNGCDDPRLTKIGRFIRKTSIDELPQILNVLKGEMSLIGPRPDLPDAVSLYQDNEILKLSVRPGITGYNQAYYRNSISLHDRLSNDLYYVNNVSFTLDCKIFFKTLQTVFVKNGVYINKKDGDV